MTQSTPRCPGNKTVLPVPIDDVAQPTSLPMRFASERPTDTPSYLLCNCRGDTEYTAISLADAKAYTGHHCRNCQMVRQGEHKTRPCPYCTTEIKLSAWPQHVRACTDARTDATAETDPDGDLATTDTPPATRSIAGTSARSYTSPSQE